MNLYNFRVDDGREGEMVMCEKINQFHSVFNSFLIMYFTLFRIQFGLTLDKTRSDAMNPFIDNHQDKCILEEPASMQHNGPIAYLNMDLKNLQYDFTKIPFRNKNVQINFSLVFLKSDCELFEGLAQHSYLQGPIDSNQIVWNKTR